MDAKTHILISGDETVTATESDGGTLLTCPANQPEWGVTCDELLFEITVLAVNGSPSAWSLGVKFQRWVPTTKGMQYQYDSWVDLDAVALATDVKEGVGWYSGSHADGGTGYGTIADNNDTLPITVKRTIGNFGLCARVVLLPSFTGGTSPSLSLSVNATEIVKG